MTTQWHSYCFNSLTNYHDLCKGDEVYEKSILVTVSIILFCACFSISISAIDTPWLPIEPDEAKTETSSLIEENADNTDAKEDGGHTTDALASDSEGSIEADQENSNNTLLTKIGCGSTLGGYAVMACCLTASVCHKFKKGK